MAYIGKQPVVGNFQVCDAISVVNGQAAYTMQVASANVEPENANHMLVSLNGVLQKPGSSFTISGATITFASNLVTNDVIDFIILLGDTLNIGTPSDNGVTTASIAANAVTAAKFNADVISGQTALAAEPADTDEFLVSDAGVLKRIDYSLIKGGGTYEVVAAVDYSSAVSNFTITDCFTSTYQVYKVIGHNISGASNEKLFVQCLDSGGSAISGWDHVHSLAYVNESTGGGGDTYTSNANESYFKFMNYEFSGNTTNLAAFDWTFYQPYESQYTFVSGRSIIDADNGHTYGGGLSAVLPSTTSARSLKFYLESGGNFSGYKITVLGMKRA